MSPSVRPHDERGFTLVEVMVAILILLVGVLGVVSMVEGANAVTSKTRARKGGHQHRPLDHRGLALDPLSRPDRQRSCSTRSGSRPGLADVKPAVTGYTIRSRNIEYETTLTVCSLDDPRTDSARTSDPSPTARTPTWSARASRTRTATRTTTSACASRST